MSLALRGRSDQQVVYIDKNSAPRIFHYGEDFLYEDLPVGTRVIYPNPPIQGLPNPKAAIRYALNHPLGCNPLFAQLEPGMRVTIAVDDISLPLPPMTTPDYRQLAIEAILEQLADNAIDDVHIIVANSLHRRMTEAEMKRMVGQEIHDEFYPERYYCHDAEDPDGMLKIGETHHGEPLRLNRRAAESDLVIYVNINLVPMDGGHKSVAVGLCDYESLRAHHEPQTILDSDSYMDPPRSELSRKVDRLGAIVDKEMNVFHVEMTLNNRMYASAMDFLAKNEDDFTETDKLKFEAMRWGMRKLPRQARRAAMHAIPAQFQLIACYAGKTELVHEKILARCFDQYSVSVKGQADILIFGMPYISPYNVNSILNPILIQVMAPGYLFNMYRGKPLVRKGGVIIFTHPCHDEFDPDFHPSYIEFFNRLLPETRDAFALRSKYEEQFAKNPSYIQMYRDGNAYHGAHPFFMWYWGENGRQHVGKIIAAGVKEPHVPERLGFGHAESLSEAIAQAKSFLGGNSSITMLKIPPIVIPEVN